MEIIKKIEKLKKSIEETDQLIDHLISNLETQKNNVKNKDKYIHQLKEEVQLNIDKIDEIIEKNNGNS